MPTSLFPVDGLLSSAQLGLSFLNEAESSTPSISVTPQIEDMLSSGCSVAIGVSGGKDSQACAIATLKYLDEVGHTGPRVLIHSDLGVAEWKASLPTCQRLADHLGLELIVVRRVAGDMLDRWQKRWENNVARYNDLSCVRLILPWSTPGLRFCTSELKSSVIASALKKRFAGMPIVSVTGIRRQESSSRSRMPVAADDPRLMRKGYQGAVWNPIIDWRIEHVFATIKDAGLELHEAYTRYGVSRVSCVYCIMGSKKDLAAAATCEDNQAVYLAMVELEASSAFAFQGGRWLADTAPHLLPASLVDRIEKGKKLAEDRHSIGAEIPDHLLYTKGWPTIMPIPEEAELIASVRRRISALCGLNADYLSGESVLSRYAELYDMKNSKEKVQ